MERYIGNDALICQNRFPNFSSSSNRGIDPARDFAFPTALERRRSRLDSVMRSIIIDTDKLDAYPSLLFAYNKGKNMTIRRLYASLLAGSISLISIQAFAGDADFTLLNGTGYTIREVYISAANKNDWGKDRLGEGDLANGRSRLFKFRDAANCVQDIKVVFDDSDESVTWEDLDLCEINKLTLKYNRSTKVVTAIKD